MRGDRCEDSCDPQPGVTPSKAWVGLGGLGLDAAFPLSADLPLDVRRCDLVSVKAQNVDEMSMKAPLGLAGVPEPHCVTSVVCVCVLDCSGAKKSGSNFTETRRGHKVTVCKGQESLDWTWRRTRGGGPAPGCAACRGNTPQAAGCSLSTKGLLGFDLHVRFGFICSSH